MNLNYITLAVTSKTDAARPRQSTWLCPGPRGRSGPHPARDSNHNRKTSTTDPDPSWLFLRTQSLDAPARMSWPDHPTHEIKALCSILRSVLRTPRALSKVSRLKRTDSQLFDRSTAPRSRSSTASSRLMRKPLPQHRHKYPTKTQIDRAVLAARSSGIDVCGLQVSPDGTIRIYGPGTAPLPAPANDFDRFEADL
jgi:hypothetical protein